MKKIRLRDTRGNESFALRISNPSYNYSSKPALSKHKKGKTTAEPPIRREKERIWWREGSKKWRRTHLKAHAAYQRLWRNNNPEKYKAIMKRHYDKVKSQKSNKKQEQQEGHNIRKIGSKS